MVNFKPGEYMKNVFSVRPTGGSEEKNPSTPRKSRTYDLLVNSRDVSLTE